MLFYALAALWVGAVVFAILALLQGTLYASALCLLVVLLQVALFFFLLGAQLLGFLQTLIYAGAIMVLLIVAVMSTEGKLSALWAKLRMPAWTVALALAVPFAELAAFLRWRAPQAAPISPAPPGLERAMAALLFGPYALLTELIGVLILIAALSALPEEPGAGSR